MASEPEHWLNELVGEFGAEAKAKLSGPGDREANIRAPLESMLVAIAERMGYSATFYDEVSDFDRGVRPDYAFSVDGAIAGYVEVKRPGHNLDPAEFHGHDLTQWERQRDLPNLLYTNGTEFRLYRDSEPVGVPVNLAGAGLATAGASLSAPAEFEALMANLFSWSPVAIRSVTRLVSAVAPLTRLLREAVLEQLEIESEPGVPDNQKPFSGLADDWRHLLFPEATDEVFADGYAQTVTFALLLARTEGIDMVGQELHAVGGLLDDRHSLMGRALQLLTDQIAGEFKVTLDLLVRVVGAVEWEGIQAGSRDAYLHLYEKFLHVYDPDLQRQSGSYYTPVEVVDEMVRLTDEVLRTKLDSDGFRDAGVTTVDPAMGTGTYLQSIIERAAAEAETESGPGSVPDELTSLAERLIGFELQTGPFAVAELRLSELMRTHEAELPEGGMRLYVSDTLDDPHAPEQILASSLQAISSSRSAAARIKREERVRVVIGNPPYGENASDAGSWVAHGSAQDDAAHAILKDFRVPGDGVFAQNIMNLYVFFWRWATWKVFDSLPTDRSGVVCFITTSGYLKGPGFRGMRDYLRRTCSEGWVIDVSPEGMRPAVNTRIFPGVQQPLAIGIFVRQPETDTAVPADIWWREIGGLRAEKYEALQNVTLDDTGWRAARTDWQSPFSPAAGSDWDLFPAMSDIFPWYSPGVAANRTWVYAPQREILGRRWDRIVGTTDPIIKAELFKESRDAHLAKEKDPLLGSPTNQFEGAFSQETGPLPETERVCYRSFDRQITVPDSRLFHAPRPPLWASRVPGQIYAIEQNANEIDSGPGLMFSNLIPEMDSFNNRGGRVLAMLHPDGSANLAPAFLSVLEAHFGSAVTPDDWMAYLAGATAHSGFVEHFADELSVPGIRVPITKDGEL